MGVESPLGECQYYKFLKRRQDSVMMFTWVQCSKFNLPSVSVQKAISQFLDFYNIDGDTKALETEYNRILKDLMESERTT